MALTVTSTHRRVVMSALLGLAVLGAVLRSVADNPSALRDIGTVLLVLWLPAIGSVIGYLKNKLPPSAPPPTHFAEESEFAPQLRVHLAKVALPPGFVDLLDPEEARATLVLGRQGFTVRMAVPVMAWFAGDAPHEVPLELLRPSVALPHLPAGTGFHLLMGTTAVAKGHVCEIIGA